MVTKNSPCCRDVPAYNYVCKNLNRSACRTNWIIRPAKLGELELRSAGAYRSPHTFVRKWTRRVEPDTRRWSGRAVDDVNLLPGHEVMRHGRVTSYETSGSCAACQCKQVLPDCCRTS